MRRRNILYGLGVVCLCLAGCGLMGDKEGESVNISGKLGTSVAKGFSMQSTVDKICALPIIGGQIRDEITTYMKTATIASDGSFSISLEKEIDGLPADWVIVLINSAAQQKIDQIVGYVALNDPSNSLIRMPTASATGDIDLGTMEKEGDEVKSEQVIDSIQTFSLSVDQLKEMAKTDVTLKLLKNAYANYNDGQVIRTSPSYVFKALPPDQLKNAFADPNDFIMLDRMRFSAYVSSNTSAMLSYSQINANPGQLVMVPPTAVTPALAHLWDPLDPTAWLGAPWARIPADSCWYREDPNDVFFIQYGGFAGEFPQGNWVLEKSGQEIGRFDFGIGSPFDSTTKKFTIYVPCPKVNLDSENRVTSVEIKWVFWNSEAGAYADANPENLARSIANAKLDLEQDGADGTKGKEVAASETIMLTTGVALNSVTPTGTWYFFDEADTTKQKLDDVRIAYASNGFDLSLSWRYK